MSVSDGIASIGCASDCTSESVPLNAKLLVVTSYVWPTPTASASVVRGILSRLEPKQTVLAAERNPENSPEQTLDNFGHRIHFFDTKWTWPQRGRKYVHWLKWLTMPRVASRLLRIARRESCQAVFVNFPTEQSLYAACYVARRLKLPLFAYFHNTYAENRQGLAGRFARRLQSRVFAKAKAIFVMSEGMRQEWAQQYPGVNFVPLIHTFNGIIPAFEAQPAIDRARIRLGYLGAVNHSNLDALRRICELVKASPDLCLNIYSGGTPEWYLRKEGLNGDRIYYQVPSDEELDTVLKSNDLLVLPHGLAGRLPAIEYRTIFPTRTIPYLLAGRPILAHCPADTFLSQWLKRNDCAELVDQPDPTQLRQAIDRLAESPQRREQLVRNSLTAVKQFSAAVVVDELKRTINRFV